MNRACFTQNTTKQQRSHERSELNLHEQNQHASCIRPLKNNFVRIKTKAIKSSVLIATLNVPSGAAVSNSPHSYLIGGIIALLIMGYLVYTLLRPDKF